MSAAQAAGPRVDARYPSIPYVAPFVVFMAFFALEWTLPLRVETLYPIRVAAVLAVLAAVSRGSVDWKASHAPGSILMGVAVFLIWIAPDALWPAYRNHWLFTNAITGDAHSTAPESLRSNVVFIIFRSAGCVILVPVIEALFWRGWLSRWMIDHDIRRVPLGAFTAMSFWGGSLLFASEHGPFWDVGFVAGVAYNWWMRRTRNLANCILAHAVTNGCLTVYVLMAGQWQHWL